jgi:hypothetical protein
MSLSWQLGMEESDIGALSWQLGMEDRPSKGAKDCPNFLGTWGVRNRLVVIFIAAL